MSKRVWHKGPPPHVGWWNASNIKVKCAWRWWNGRNWSCVAFPGLSTGITKRAKTIDKDQGYIEWTTYYPKNARVPRIKP